MKVNECRNDHKCRNENKSISENESRNKTEWRHENEYRNEMNTGMGHFVGQFGVMLRIRENPQI